MSNSPLFCSLYAVVIKDMLGHCISWVLYLLGDIDKKHYLGIFSTHFFLSFTLS